MIEKCAQLGHGTWGCKIASALRLAHVTAVDVLYAHSVHVWDEAAQIRTPTIPLFAGSIGEDRGRLIVDDGTQEQLNQGDVIMAFGHSDRLGFEAD